MVMLRLKDIWRGQQKEFRDRFLGIFYILCVSGIWVAASYLVKNLEKDAEPFVITYISNALFLVFLPIAKVSAWMKRKALRNYEQAESSEETSEEIEEDSLVAKVSWMKLPENMSEMDYIRAAAMIWPIWWVGQLLFNISLKLTSVSSNTILSSTSSLFTFFLSMGILQEPFVKHKLLGVITIIGGDIAVTLGDSSKTENASNPILGDIFAILSALLYGLYITSLKKALPKQQDTNMTLLLGHMGLMMASIVGCLMWILHWLKIVNAIILRRVFFWAVVKGLVDNVLTHYLWAKAMLLIGPTVATAGLSLQGPVTLLLEIVFGHPAWLRNGVSTFLKFFGTMLILLGFYDLNVEEPLFKTCYNLILQLCPQSTFDNRISA